MKCSKCNGTGYIGKWKHVANGLCFKCRGVKQEPELAMLFHGPNEQLLWVSYLEQFLTDSGITLKEMATMLTRGGTFNGWTYIKVVK